MYKITFQSHADLRPQIKECATKEEAENKILALMQANPNIEWKVLPTLEYENPPSLYVENLSQWSM